MSLRIRQIVLAARDLAATVAQCQEALGLEVVYRDPEVAKFGLENALLRVGDQFLEIISPTRPDTAAGRHLDRHGDSAYMLILQTDDLDRERRRFDKLGVRVVWESNYPNMRAAHLHPKDIGAAIVSVDEATPPSSWRWAGPDWQRDLTRDQGRRIVGATIAAREPAEMARRWSQVLDLEASARDGRWSAPIRDGALEFVAVANGAERIVEFALDGNDLAATSICGTTFRTRA
jgi:hypothetical protein